MLGARILTVVIGLPAVVAIFLLVPPWGTLILFAALVLGGVYEATSLLYPAFAKSLDVTFEPQVVKRTAWCTALSAAVLFVLAACFPDMALAWCAVGMIVGLSASILCASGVPKAMAYIVGCVFAGLYVAVPVYSWWRLFLYGEQARYLFLVMAMIMASDTGAYFAGRAFGRTKIAPAYSPKKTLEGLVGGLVAGLAGGWCVIAGYGDMQLSPLWLMCAGPLVILAGVIGDLVESVLKRFASVKDSGRIFPGHGGVLDRMDSLLFAGPVLWILLSLRELII
jgi:phosphatidate cytidylyltransferase